MTVSCSNMLQIKIAPFHLCCRCLTLKQAESRSLFRLTFNSYIDVLLWCDTLQVSVSDGEGWASAALWPGTHAQSIDAQA